MFFRAYSEHRAIPGWTLDGHHMWKYDYQWSYAGLRPDIRFRFWRWIQLYGTVGWAEQYTKTDIALPSAQSKGISADFEYY